ncbi:MAG: helix-turn-helix transcriptional regulator [Prevotella sp.]|nr:helix-turn-helix transcriptional regulator [Prevotella sp.]
MLRNQIVDPLFPECPIRNVLAKVGDKWSMLVLLTIDGNKRAMRYKEIQQAVPDISQKMLSVTLHELEADGLVERIAYAEVPPRVEYRLTERSRSLMPHIHSLVGWALDNLSGILKDRKEFLKKASL